MKIQFKDFITSNESGKFLINPYWLEYLLDLFYQEYYSEFWCEVMDTVVNQKNNIERIAYGIIGENLIKENFK